MRSGRTEPTLRRRFLAATIGLALLLIGGFLLATHQFIELLEHELVEVQFRADFVRISDAWLAAPGTPPTLPSGYELRHIARSASEPLPRALRALAPGIHAEVMIDGREYTVGRREVPDGDLYLMLDAGFSPLERLEADLIEIAVAALGAAALIATAAALWLARIVLGPVERLAANAARVEPGRPRPPLAGIAPNREIAQIAAAFDRTLDRFDALLDNERAFARDASHELRTPLAVLLSGIELLESQFADDARASARLARLRAAAEQMQALIEGLLFLARPEPGAAADTGEAASEVVHDAIRVLRLACLPRVPDISFEVRQDHQLGVPRGLLLCVVGNLLRNAVEHAGESRIEIILDARGLVVADEGRGIDAAGLSSMFEAHRRGAASTGEGLGLSIVRRICERLGWPLEVSSAPGAGTRFRLDLPGQR